MFAPASTVKHRRAIASPPESLPGSATVRPAASTAPCVSCPIRLVCAIAVAAVFIGGAISWLAAPWSLRPMHRQQANQNAGEDKQSNDRVDTAASSLRKTPAIHRSRV